MLTDALATARRCGAAGLVLVRADSAYYSADIVAACRRAGVRISITARLTPAVVNAITGIDEQAWVAIRYPNAIYDENESRWVSDAEVAETMLTAFTGRRRRDHVTARLIVRRERRLNPRTLAAGQTEAFAVYRYHAVFTDSAEPMLAAEAPHRDHAIVEQVIAELKNGPLAHLPSVISSSRVDHGCEMVILVVDGVRDGGNRCLRSAWSDDFGGMVVRRVMVVGPAEDVGGAAFAERAGEGVAELLVVVFEAADALGGGVQTLQQRGGAGALPLGRDRGRGGGSVTSAEAFDVGAQVVLGVEPGPGDAGLAGEALEGDRAPVVSRRRSAATARRRV